MRPDYAPSDRDFINPDTLTCTVTPTPTACQTAATGS